MSSHWLSYWNQQKKIFGVPLLVSINKPKVPTNISVTVLKILGETNTDDLSPVPHATNRPNILRKKAKGMTSS